jgi:hypothetical protein
METNFMSHFELLRLIRDSRSTKNADRELLHALALRSDPKKSFISWPSYRQLALDTQLDEVTLRRAAKRLESARLIRRVVRANRSNCFLLNVPLLQEQAAEAKAAEDAAKEQEDVESPFGDPILNDHADSDGQW